jgi:hypothetical protein
MEETVEFLFGNSFFQLPFLEALSYVAVILLTGALIIGVTKRMMGISRQPSEATTYGEEPSREEWQEWRKAA